MDSDQYLIFPADSIAKVAIQSPDNIFIEI